VTQVLDPLAMEDQHATPGSAALEFSPAWGESLWVAEEVAAFLKVSVRWVREATRDGRLPVVNVGRYRRYSPAAIRAWVEVQAVPSRGTR
jgi:excisionase family DNA binding protein